MQTDRQGNALPAATEKAAELYSDAVHAFNIYRGDPVALADSAAEEAPDFAMAPILNAWLHGLATEPEAATAARDYVDKAEAAAKTDAEASHIAALRQLLQGDWNAAAVHLDRHNMSHPHDLVGLQAGHLLDFYRGDARAMRDRIARVSPHWSTDMPGYAIVLGMQSFGLEESGDYKHAEETGRRAVDLEPLDCWAQHAVAHALEMQGNAQHGVEWMASREEFWSGEDNFFRVHNWWHKALFHIDLGEIDAAMAIYDGEIRSEPSSVALDLVDASAFLWRMYLLEQDMGERWHDVADTWLQHANGTLYPFNDWHAVMATIGAGRDGDTARIIEGLRLAAKEANETAGWAAQIALPLAEGFAAFGNGDYSRSVELLHPVRYIANRFGGSNAQRDVIDWTLTEAAVRSGDRSLSESLAQERLARKPHSTTNLSFLRRSRQNDPGQSA